MSSFSAWLEIYGAPAGAIDAANGASRVGYNFRNRLIGQIVIAAGCAELRREFEIAARIGAAPAFGEVVEHLVLEFGRAPSELSIVLARKVAQRWWPGVGQYQWWPYSEMMQFIDRLRRAEAHWRAELAEGRMMITGWDPGGALIERSGEAAAGLRFNYSAGRIEFPDGVILIDPEISVLNPAAPIVHAPSPRISGRSTGNRKLRKAALSDAGGSRSILDDAITEIYEAYEAAGQKPPNLSELPPLVQDRLAKDGRRASVEAIRKAAKGSKFDNRRLRRGEKFK